MKIPGLQAVPREATTKAVGDEGEERALAFLRKQGLSLVERNYRTPGRGGGEIDLVMRDGGTLVFVEVRQRKNRTHGGAVWSITSAKQRRVILAARHYLVRLRETPPCRFDVVCVEGGELQWMQAAFDAG